jgi:hypothetical protein
MPMQASSPVFGHRLQPGAAADGILDLWSGRGQRLPRVLLVPQSKAQSDFLDARVGTDRQNPGDLFLPKLLPPVIDRRNCRTQHTEVSVRLLAARFQAADESFCLCIPIEIVNKSRISDVVSAHIFL